LRRHQILARNGAYEILQILYNCPGNEARLDEVIQVISHDIAEDEAIEVVQQLKGIWFLEQPPHSEFLRITEDGIEAYLLTRVINGDTLDSVLTQLSKLFYSRFSLIMEDITGCFIDTLRNFPALKEIYICSPWIRLRDTHLSDLETILNKDKKIVIRVITRIPDLEFSTFRQQILKTLSWLKGKGAEIVGHPALHTKLYIAVGKTGQTAIFGSENLTGAKNIELGIKINDETIVAKLLLYWLEIYDQCSLIEEEKLFGRRE
jgi:hypothetical protein